MVDPFSGLRLRVGLHQLLQGGVLEFVGPIFCIVEGGGWALPWTLSPSPLSPRWPPPGRFLLPGVGTGFDLSFLLLGFQLLGEAGGLGPGHLGLVGTELGRSEVIGVDRLDLPLGF